VPSALGTVWGFRTLAWCGLGGAGLLWIEQRAFRRMPARGAAQRPDASSDFRGKHEPFPDRQLGKQHIVVDWGVLFLCGGGFWIVVFLASQLIPRNLLTDCALAGGVLLG